MVDDNRATLAEAATRSSTNYDLLERAERGKKVREQRERSLKLKNLGKIAFYDLASWGSLGYAAYALSNGNPKAAAYATLISAVAKAVEYRSLWKGLKSE